MVEISTGNTSEISTSRSRKSVILVNFGPKNPDFDPEICCRQKFLRVPNFQKSKNMALQHHFALSISFITRQGILKRGLSDNLSDLCDHISRFWSKWPNFFWVKPDVLNFQKVLPVEISEVLPTQKFLLKFEDVTKNGSKTPLHQLS